MSTNLIGKRVQIVGTDTVLYVLDVIKEDTNILLVTDNPVSPTTLDEIPESCVELVEENH